MVEIGQAFESCCGQECPRSVLAATAPGVAAWLSDFRPAEVTQ